MVDDRPCAPWATVDDLCSPCNDYSYDASLMDDMLEASSWIAWRLSGRQYSGECEATVRPCARRTWSRSAGWWPAIAGSSPVWGWCSCNREEVCGCQSLAAIDLGYYPVQEVTSVKVRMERGGDLVTLTSGVDYEVVNKRYLQRIDDSETGGERPGWPCCQDQRQGESGDGVFFEVELVHGRPIPSAGRLAVASLACELYKACQPEDLGECKLPQRVTQLVRQGVSLTILDPFEFLQEGKTGVYEMDLFLSAANPNKLSRPPGVLTPELMNRNTRRS